MLAGKTKKADAASAAAAGRHLLLRWDVNRHSAADEACLTSDHAHAVLW